MRGILLSTTPGCVRGPRCVEPKRTKPGKKQHAARDYHLEP
ncbi:unnamed protein product [Penicillium camemberti]|uniref:Str. FM013 n=1 Tax=Penicillium camemberti (strain FM 013) TaxID=1429867 RepID=A0A0G4PHM6_PENC3|nr:unnamed protein product [Penicillium camemberti]